MLNLLCVICAELFTESDDVCVTQCGHIFHYACISQWLNSAASTCPQCRKSCSSYNIFKVYLESAIESSDNASVVVHRNDKIKNLEQALDLYEEVNLNLKRELKMNEENVSNCQLKLIEIRSELEEEIQLKKIMRKQVIELEKANSDLTEMLNNSKIEHQRTLNALQMEIKIRDEATKPTLERLNMPSVNKIAAQRLVAELEEENLRLTEMLNELKAPKKKDEQSSISDLSSEHLDLESLAQMIQEFKSSKEGPNRHSSVSKAEEPKSSKDVPKSSSKNSSAVNKASTVKPKKEETDTEEEFDFRSALLLGIPQKPAEDLKFIFQRLCQAIDCVQLNLKGIYRKNTTVDSPIFLKFRSHDDRSTVMKAIANYCKNKKKQLTARDIFIDSDCENKIFMREILTNKNQFLLQKAFGLKHRKLLFCVYTRLGSVYVKKTDKGNSILIENERMLNDLVKGEKPEVEKNA